MSGAVHIIDAGLHLVAMHTATGAKLGDAYRNSPRGRWTVRVGHRQYHRFRRRAARRLLHRLAVRELTARAIRAAALDTYRGDLEDRHTGWRAPR